MTADPGFVLTGTLVCLFIVETTSSFVLYYFLTGFEDERSQFVLSLLCSTLLISQRSFDSVFERFSS
ncbi:hypothetical protein ACFFOL_15385, partial [Halobaculum roseum]